MSTRTALEQSMDRLELLVRAGYPVIYIVSHEEGRVRDYVAKLYRVLAGSPARKTLLTFSASDGLKQYDLPTTGSEFEHERDWLRLPGWDPSVTPQNRGDASPARALEAVRTDGDFAKDALCVFLDMHHGLLADSGGGAGPLVRPLRNAAESLRRYYEANRLAGNAAYKTMIVVAPSAARLSPELDRDVMVVDFPLPEHDELALALDRMLESKMIGFPEKASDADLQEVCGDGTGQERQTEYRTRIRELIAGAGRGLTLEDYKLGLNMFAVRKEALAPRHVEDLLHLKAKAINNDALLYTPHVNVKLGGLKSAVEWLDIRREPTISSEVRRKYHLPPAKGVMLCGASGGGKSQLAKLIAKRFNLALLRLDIGALFGMYVGESEERTRTALKLAQVLAPVVLWLDEIDKAFQGIGGGGDNGVSSRVFGHFLTWLAEKEDSVFVVATANDFKDLLERFPEFGRKGRFDEIFWVDLPDEDAKTEIFKIYLEPHVNSGYLALDDAQIDELADGAQPPPGDSLDRFCAVLATKSPKMTGAEIEYSVTQALYRALELDTSGLTTTFTVKVIAESVQIIAARALYRGGSPDDIKLIALRKLAADRHWVTTH